MSLNRGPSATSPRTARRVAWAFAIGLVFSASSGLCAAPQRSPQPVSLEDDLRDYAVHINRTPAQPWPGYGMYLGNGYILTAAHVPGNFADTRPRAIVGGADQPTALVKQGSLEGVDLTLLRVDPNTLPVRLQMRRLPLCPAAPFPGEAVVVVTPENVAQSHVLPPTALPPNVPTRFDTVIGDVATTGNSGSGVLDAHRTCLLGVISRKISVTSPGSPAQSRDIAKYFVPVGDIRAFLPADVSF